MKRSRFSEEQIIGMLKEAEATLVVKESHPKNGAKEIAPQPNSRSNDSPGHVRQAQHQRCDLLQTGSANTVGSRWMKRGDCERVFSTAGPEKKHTSKRSETAWRSRSIVWEPPATGRCIISSRRPVTLEPWHTKTVSGPPRFIRPFEPTGFQKYFR
jgi:hypothetical protein